LAAAGACGRAAAAGGGGACAAGGGVLTAGGPAASGDAARCGAFACCCCLGEGLLRFEGPVCLAALSYCRTLPRAFCTQLNSPGLAWRSASGWQVQQ
jgi:hypothetical protein